MTRPARTLALLAAAAVLLGGCGGGPDKDDSVGADLPDGMVAVHTDLGTVARPTEWKPLEDAAIKDRVAGFMIIGDGKQVVGQMDVFVNGIAPGTRADSLAGAIEAQRMPSFPDLRHTRRDFVDVPGAESAFVTESTYTTADSGEDARSIDQVAVTEDGDYLLVRISSSAAAYDEQLFEQVMDTMTLHGGESS
jgi:hypothetical protein